jgi:hypothetical protein
MTFFTTIAKERLRKDGFARNQINALVAIRFQTESFVFVILGLVSSFQGITMNVVPLSQPNPWLIELLTDLLARAEQGDLYSLVYCAEKRGGDIETGFTTHMNRMMMVAGLEKAKFTLLTEMNRDSSCVEIDNGS